MLSDPGSLPGISTNVNILDLFFPKRCVGCGKFGRYFCSSCRASIRIIEPNESICPMCERLAVDGVTHPGCQTRYAIDGLTTFFRYTGPVRQAIKQLKYGRVSDLAREFISLIPRLTIYDSRFTSKHTVLVPIPLHPSRFRDRGFNQAEVLEKLIAERLNLPVKTDILRRVKRTVPQVDMKDRDERMKNMKDVFSISEDALTRGHADTVLLVDDVFTTGATMRSAANVLKRAGAKFVWGITMAR